MEPIQLWSWLLTGVGVTGLYIAGKKNWVGWAIGLAAQVLWVAYAIHTKQWGFIASAGFYGAVYLRNVQRWRKEKRDNLMDSADMAVLEMIKKNMYGPSVMLPAPTGPCCEHACAQPHPEPLEFPLDFSNDKRTQPEEQRHP